MEKSVPSLAPSHELYCPKARPIYWSVWERY
jgi:hypothetical protein